jgi:hypothetical protein
MGLLAFHRQGKAVDRGHCGAGPHRQGTTRLAKAYVHQTRRLVFQSDTFFQHQFRPTLLTRRRAFFRRLEDQHD